MTLSFKPVTLDFRETYHRFLQKNEQAASDYSFINIWGWADVYGLIWALADELLLIKQTRPEIAFWAPVGQWEHVDWKRWFKIHGLDRHSFVRIPEKLMNCWRQIFQNTISIKETREHWDYIYSAQDLIQLRGNRLHKKKNLVNQFKKKYNYSYHPISHSLVNKVNQMQDAWCLWRDCESSELLSSENSVIERVLSNWEHLPGIMGGALLIEECMVAYTIAEIFTSDTVLIHFEKADPGFKGSYQAINQMFLENLQVEIGQVNREQDLGDEGLRKAKLSYFPIDFIKKYTVTL